MKTNLSVNIGELKLKNPVMVASGTFGYSQEFEGLVDLKRLGAIVTKTITLNPRKGNPMPRTCETASGMLNSIGLENPGLYGFIEKKIPYLKKIGVPIIVSISSENDSREFVEMVKRLDKIRCVSAIELNISCPNIHKRVQGPRHKEGPRLPSASLGFAERRAPRGERREASAQAGDRVQDLISQDPRATYEVVKSARKITGKTLITKLSPNVTDVVSIAKAAKEAGSDAISMINTFYGISVNIDTQRPRLGNITGGLSGPAIKPIALKMVLDVAKNVNLPIIGMGGIMNASDALEFLICGATAVAVGTANFINPSVTIDVIDGVTAYMRKHRIKDIRELIGSLKA